MRTSARASVLLVVGLAFALPPAPIVASSAAACASDAHLAVTWSAFPAPVVSLAPPRFYWAAEPGTADPTLTVEVFGEDCPVPDTPRPVSARYQVMAYPGGTPRAAASGAGGDFLPVDGNTPALCDIHGGAPFCNDGISHAFPVDVLDDFALEPVAERARALLSPAATPHAGCAPPCSAARVQEPFDVPLWIVDNEPPDRIAFETPGVTERSEVYPSIYVGVFRAGPATGPATYQVSAAGSGPNPATPGADFTVAPTISFGAGERAKLVEVKVVNDKLGEGDEELTLTLTDPGVLLPDEDVAASVVRILDNEEPGPGGGGTAPVTRLHHPKHKKKYARGDYRLREIHVFATDAGGAGVAQVELALRRTKRNGSCQWWRGKRFRPGGCRDQRWVELDYYPQADWYFYRLAPLKPSVGTNVRSYQAWARGTDDSGNVETTFTKKRNRNTFEVLRRKG